MQQQPAQPQPGGMYPDLNANAPARRPYMYSEPPLVTGLYPDTATLTAHDGAAGSGPGGSGVGGVAVANPYAYDARGPQPSAAPAQQVPLTDTSAVRQQYYDQSASLHVSGEQKHDNYMQQQIDALAGVTSRPAAPAMAQKPSLGQMVHPSMMPGGGAGGVRPQPPPNLYYNGATTPAAAPPGNVAVSAPVLYQYGAPAPQQQAPPAYAAPAAQSMPLLQPQQQPPQAPAPTPPAQSGVVTQTAATPVKKPDQQPSFPAPAPPAGQPLLPTIQQQQHQQQPSSPVTPLFATPTKDVPAKDAVPPVPLRLLPPQQQESPAALTGATPPPRPGDLLIPTGPLPPVPPRSPKVSDRNKTTSATDLLGWQKSPQLGKRSGAEQQSKALGGGGGAGNNNNNNATNLVQFKDDWEIEVTDLVFEKEIASGTFGSVWKGQYLRTPCAIKKLHGTKLTEQQLREFHAEVHIMKKLRHPNVVLFMGFCHDDKTGAMFMVFEFMERGSLWNIIHDKRVFISQPMRVKMCQDIARGLFYLHSLRPPVVHRDIKSPNILADGAMTMKVADFGLSKTRQYLQEAMTSQAGTYQYMAPEVIQGTDYSIKADVFSYAVVMWEILVRLPVYHGIAPMTLAYKVVNEGLRPAIPMNTDPAYSQLMQACWATNPDMRPSFDFVLDSLATMLPPDKK